VVNLVDCAFHRAQPPQQTRPELEKGDFKIWDDKAPQEIRYFSRQSDLPLRIGMLLDTSKQYPRPHQVRAGCFRQFFCLACFAAIKIEAFVMTFDDEPQIVPGLHRRCRSTARPESPGRARAAAPQFYDAIYEACVKELKPSDRARRAISRTWCAAS